jgi:phage terminase small subunit
MTRDEYEERLRALEAQLQTDIALVHAGHEARVRSLGNLWQTAALAPVPAAAPKKTARPAWSTLDEIEKALPRLPEVFDKRDIIRVLGYMPAYSTLLRALAELKESGEIADTEGYAYRSQYRKVSRPGRG